MACRTVVSNLKFKGLGRLAMALAVASLSTGLSSFAAENAVEKATDRMLEVGITKPADQKPRELRFKSLGMIKSVNVKEGDIVKAGQVLMAQDDTDETAELEIRRKDVTEIGIKAAEVTSRAKKAELKLIKQIHDQDAKNEAEYEKALAEAEIADLKIEQEKQDLEVRKAKVKQQQNVVDRMTLHSPIDGIVQTVEADVGEMVDPSKPPVVTIVNNTPLMVEVNLPTAISLRLKLDQILRVSYDKKDWKDAKVSFLAPMADAASGMQKVHLTTPNAEGKTSGLQIFVELPDVQLAGN